MNPTVLDREIETFRAQVHQTKQGLPANLPTLLGQLAPFNRGSSFKFWDDSDFTFANVVRTSLREYLCDDATRINPQIVPIQKETADGICPHLDTFNLLVSQVLEGLDGEAIAQNPPTQGKSPLFLRNLETLVNSFWPLTDAVEQQKQDWSARTGFPL